MTVIYSTYPVKIFLKNVE